MLSFLALLALFPAFSHFFLFAKEKDIKMSKKTSKQCAKHPFVDQNTQRVCMRV